VTRHAAERGEELRDAEPLFLLRLIGEDLRIQVMAATNSMHTPTKVAHRQKMNVERLWLNAPRTARNE